MSYQKSGFNGIFNPCVLRKVSKGSDLFVQLILCNKLVNDDIRADLDKLNKLKSVIFHEIYRVKGKAVAVDNDVVSVSKAFELLDTERSGINSLFWELISLLESFVTHVGDVYKAHPEIIIKNCSVNLNGDQVKQLDVYINNLQNLFNFDKKNECEEVDITDLDIPEELVYFLFVCIFKSPKQELSELLLIEGGVLGLVDVALGLNNQLKIFSKRV